MLDSAKHKANQAAYDKATQVLQTQLEEAAATAAQLREDNAQLRKQVDQSVSDLQTLDETRARLANAA